MIIAGKRIIIIRRGGVSLLTNQKLTGYHTKNGSILLVHVSYVVIN
jgi:hypothetical protein